MPYNINKDVEYMYITGEREEISIGSTRELFQYIFDSL